MNRDPLSMLVTGQALRTRLFASLAQQRRARAPQFEPGECVGPWQIIRHLGQGGMSDVYLAERASAEFRQQVALKVVRYDPQLVERLRHERRVIAALQHPGIVGFIDGGQLGEETLWFAMEPVFGRHLDDYARERRLDWVERVLLIEDLCGAVGHAHANLLVHRDLKPSNVLVDDEGRVHLLDFGIAVASETAGSPNDHAFTPEYASPEQRAGAVITTASDIYQLGQLLGVLLLPDGAPCATLPRAPSRRILRDLHCIIMRASAAEPSARYATVAALRGDLVALRSHCAVDARDGGLLYRLARLFERNGPATAVAALAILVLVGALVAHTRSVTAERDRALASEEKAQSITRYLIDVFSSANPSATPGESISVLQALDEGMTKLTETALPSPATRLVLKTAMARIYLEIHEPQRAIDLLATELNRPRPVEVSVAERFDAHLAYSDALLFNSDTKGALAQIAAAEQVAAESPEEFERLQATALVYKGQILSEASDDSGVATLKDALQRVERIHGTDHELTFMAHTYLAEAYGLTDRQESLRHAREAYDIALRIAGPGHRRTIQAAIKWSGAERDAGNLEAAEPILQRAIAEAKTLRVRDGRSEFLLAYAQVNSAMLLRRQKKYAECSGAAAEAITSYESRAGANSEYLVSPLMESGRCRYWLGDLALAQSHLLRAADISRAIHGNTYVTLAFIQDDLARVQLRMGDFAEALKSSDAGLEVLAHTQTDPAYVAALHVTKAETLIASGANSAARERVQAAQELLAASKLAATDTRARIAALEAQL